MADVVKTLPPEAGALSGARRLMYLVIMNRVQIGVFALVVTGLVATFISDDDVRGHKRIHAVEQLIILLTGAAAGASVGGAKFKSNEFHERRMAEEIRQKSGAWRPPKQRRSDRKPDDPGSTAEMERVDESTSIEDVIPEVKDGKPQEEGSSPHRDRDPFKPTHRRRHPYRKD